jgi:hypothetical protein
MSERDTNRRPRPTRCEPLTPLPWYVCATVDGEEIHARNRLGSTVVVAGPIRRDQDARYIEAAANAYPKLIGNVKSRLETCRVNLQPFSDIAADWQMPTKFVRCACPDCQQDRDLLSELAETKDLCYSNTAARRCG